MPRALVVLVLSATVLCAQGAGTEARTVTLHALRTHAQRTDALASAAPTIVPLLVDPDAEIRHEALRIVLQRPAAFVAHADTMHALLAGNPPDDSVLRAVAAVITAQPVQREGEAAVVAPRDQWNPRRAHQPDQPRHDLRDIAQVDSAAHERIAAACASPDVAVTQAALQALVDLGPAAAEYWPHVAPCLRSALLVSSACEVAANVHELRPEAVAAMIAVIPGADAQTLGTLAQHLLRCGDAARAAAAPLATRTAAVAPAPLAALDAVFVLGGREQLTPLLPRLLASADPNVRARACLLAAALDVPDDLVQQVADLCRDADARVASDAMYAVRWLRGEPRGAERVDGVRSANDMRALAAFCRVRAQQQLADEVECGGIDRLASVNQLGSWLGRTLLTDLQAGRLTVRELVDALQSADGRLSPLLRRELQRAPRGCQVLGEIARRKEAVVARIRRFGKKPAEIVAAMTEERETRANEQLRLLGSDDPLIRSDACAELSATDLRTLRAELATLRRSGSAAQRRCAAALVDPMTAARARTALTAPEPWIAMLGMERLGSLTADRTPSPEVRAALAARTDVVTSCRRWPHAAGRWLGSMATQGEAAVPVFRTAMAYPPLRSAAIQAAPLLGPAARSLFPELLRALRTPYRHAAARALLHAAPSPGSPEHAELRIEVEALWHEPIHHRDLLPVVAALGTDTAFAAKALRELVTRGTLADASIAPGGPLHGWLKLAMLGDAETQRQIALLLLVTDALPGPGGASDALSADMWARASSSAGLGRTMTELVAMAGADELRELYSSTIDACAAGRRLPATAVLFAARPALVHELLSARTKPITESLATDLAITVPVVLLRVLTTRPDRDANERSRLESALRRVPSSSEVTKELEAMAAGTTEPPRWLATAIVGQGERAAHLVHAELEHGGERAAAMATALAAAGSSAEWAVPALRRWSSPEGPVTHEVIGMLGASGLNVVVADLEPPAIVRILQRNALSGDSRTRCAALRLLMELAPDAALDSARANRDAADADVRRWASLILLTRTQQTIDADAMLALLEDPLPLFRRRALEALAAATTWPEQLAVRATDLLADPDQDVRRAAVAAFQAHRAEVPASRRALEEAATDATDPTVAEAIRELLETR